MVTVSTPSRKSGLRAVSADSAERTTISRRGFTQTWKESRPSFSKSADSPLRKVRFDAVDDTRPMSLGMESSTMRATSPSSSSIEPLRAWAICAQA
jgi:hypothetical protein